MSNLNPTPAYASPSSFTMLTSETLPLGFDATNYLVGSQTPSSPSSVLTNLATDATVTLSNSPTVSGNIITQIVDGSALTAGTQYRLAVTFTAAASTVWTMLLLVNVPL